MLHSAWSKEGWGGEEGIDVGKKGEQGDYPDSESVTGAFSPWYFASFLR